MTLFYLPFLLLGAGIAVYFYFFLRRITDTFGIDRRRLGLKLLRFILAFCFGVLFVTFPSLASLIILHLFAAVAIVQLIHFLLRLAIKKKYSFWERLYGCGVIPIVLTVAVILGGYWNMHHVVQTDYRINTEKSIRKEGYRVALLADIHFGVSLDEEALLRVCRRISEQKPDLVILCGDIVDNATSKEEMDAVFRALGSIESEFGVFYVYGNHDRPMSMLASAFSLEELNRSIEENGIVILKDETYAITNELVLVGRDDRGFGGEEGRLSIEELLQEADREDYILTLDHQPNDYSENGAAGTDLLLSGHTHGGQIWPVNLLDRLFRFNDAVYGLTQIDADSQAIVTSGIAGWNWPVKTSAPAEYVIIDIQNAEDEE